MRVSPAASKGAVDVCKWTDIERIEEFICKGETPTDDSQATPEILDHGLRVFTKDERSYTVARSNTFRLDRLLGYFRRAGTAHRIQWETLDD